MKQALLRPARPTLVPIRLCPQGARSRQVCKATTETPTGFGQKFKTETMPWLKDLIEPWTSGPVDMPATRSARELGQADSKFADVNGISVHYTEIGTPNPTVPSLVLWHGLNGSVFNWRYVTRILEKAGKYHVIAFDRPPFGLTERPPAPASGVNPYSTDGAITLVRGLLEQKGVSRAIHAGHSAGANASLKMALQHSDEVEGLIFVSPAISPTPRTTNTDFSSKMRTLYTKALFGTPAGLRMIQKRLLARSEEVRKGGGVGRFDNSKVTQEDIDLYLLPMQAHNWDMGALENFKTFTMKTEPPNIASVQLPVLVLQGKEDGATTLPFVRKFVDALEARPVGSTRMVEIDACGHLPMEEHPEVIAANIAEYLDLRAADLSKLQAVA